MITQYNIDELIQKLPQKTKTTVLFIDEFEQLKNKNSLNILWWLYQYLPTNYHVVIASRIRPEWNLAKEILQGRIQVVTENQLSLKPEDTPRLIEFLYRQNPEHAVMDFELAQLLIDKTEGWITGVQLTNLYLKDHQDIIGFVHNLNGENYQIANYLSEQVFSQQDINIQKFLLQMSVLRKANLALVMTLTGNEDAQQILNTIGQKGLFVQALDEQRTWYRLHHFFRDFLQSKYKLTQVDVYKQMHRKAAEWFKQRGFLMEAIYHVQQTEDEQLMLSLLNDVSRELVIKGRKYTLLELVKQLPEAVLVTNPRLLYDVIWSLLLTHQSALAHHYLQLWHSVDQHETLLEHEDQLGLAPLIAFLEDKLDVAYDLAQQNLEKLTSTAYFARAPLVGISALYHICLGEIDTARKLISQTRIIYIQHHSVYGLAIADCFDALCDYLLGDLNLAAEKFNQIGLNDEYKKLGFDEANKAAIKNIFSSFKADLYYELNQMEQVEDALSDFKGGEYFAVPDIVVIGYILKMRLATLQQDQSAVQACLNQVQTRSSQWSLSRISKTVQTYVQESKGSCLELKNIEQTTAKPFLNVTHLLRGDDLIIVRAQIFTGRIQQAKQYLIQQLPFFRDYPLRQARIKLLLALALYKLQQNEQAFDYLQQALESIMPTQAVRIILDEHPLIWEMLNQLSTILALNKRNNNSEIITYIQNLFTLVSPQDMREREYIYDDNLCEKEILSKREIQIIEKVSIGLTDVEIADLVFLSVNTVKWHLRNIYNKLKVRSRLEAIIEAKKKGYII